jgi:hypothetical protein
MPPLGPLTWLVAISPIAVGCGGLATDRGTSNGADGGSASRDASRTTEREATTDPSRDGDLRDTPSLGDAGTAPPDFCVPPCVWRALVRCTPPLARTCHEVAPPAPASPSVTCDPDSGWFTTRLDQFSAGVIVTYGHASKTCFTVRYGGKVPNGIRTFTDGTTTIAFYGVPTAPVHCADDQRDYALDPTNPACAPWTMGGYGVVQPALACESTVPGPCDAAP